MMMVMMMMDDGDDGECVYFDDLFPCDQMMYQP